MKLLIKCDFCHREFYKDSNRLTKHNFCCRECLANFSNKSKNPDGYASLKDFTNISATLSNNNKITNKTRMTAEVRDKLRKAKLNKGKCVTYTKRYGVHEHRIVAEEMLGRKLKVGEVVHHKDGNKRNNNPSNIMIFASQSEHAKFHAELKQILKLLNS